MAYYLSGQVRPSLWLQDTKKKRKENLLVLLLSIPSCFLISVTSFFMFLCLSFPSSCFLNAVAVCLFSHRHSLSLLETWSRFQHCCCHLRRSRAAHEQWHQPVALHSSSEWDCLTLRSCSYSTSPFGVFPKASQKQMVLPGAVLTEHDAFCSAASSQLNQLYPSLLLTCQVQGEPS